MVTSHKREVCFKGGESRAYTRHKVKTRIQYDDFLNNRVLTNLKMNESKTKGLYFVNVLDLEANCYEKDVAIFELEGLETKFLDIDIKPDDFEFFYEKVIFKLYEDEYTKLYCYDFNTGEIELYASIPYKIESFHILDDDIYFTATIRTNDKNEFIRYGMEVPFYQEGVGYSAHNRTCLFRANCKVSGISRLTALNIHIDDLIFDFKNNRIVFTAFKYESSRPVISDVYIYHIVNKTTTRLTNSFYRISYVDVLSSEQLIFAGVSLNEKKRNDNQQLYVIEVSSGHCKSLDQPQDRSNLTPGVCTDMKFTTSRPVMSIEGNFYFVTTDRNQETLNKINAEGEIISFETGLKTIDSYQVLKEGILIIGLKGLGLHELYWFNGEQLIQVTEYNEWLLKGRQISVPEPIKIYDKETEIDGWVIPPADIHPNKKYPGILMIHGGPKLTYSDVYHHNMQLLSANGYYVFYANPKGSDGRGDDFLDIRGNFGTTAYKELMAFTDVVINSYPQIDQNALGVTGYSYGGYMTNYIITRTNRFKAAVSESGISNLLTAFTSSDIGYQYILEYMDNESPWIKVNSYLEASPIMMASKVTTPTLFIHGNEDCRCNYTESYNMYAALNFHGVTTKLCLCAGEDHGLDTVGKPKVRMFRYLEILNWFNEFLKRSK